MNDACRSEQQRAFERLAGAVSLQGWRDFDVLLAFGKLMIERNGGRASCTVIMLPNEPTFLARFAFRTKPADPILFTVGEGAYPAVREATKRFGGADDAAQWLLKFLETSDQAV